MEQSTRINIPGYEVRTVLRENDLYRATRIGDSQSVLIKYVGDDANRARQRARLRREFDIGRELHLPGVIRPLALEDSNTLVMEDFPGACLRDLIQAGPLSPAEFLRIALALTRVLSEIHARGIIHKDIKTDGILINEHGILLLDFGIASHLSREEQSTRAPASLEGTPVYVSPEQTGRMNRSLDYRSDFYSLGVTLYELLLGEPPFVSSDPMELVHAHIARLPQAPHEKDPAVYPAVSQIIMKLLAKTAENRYQSAHGLYADLEFCAEQLRATGSIPNFAPAEQDRSEVFHIPEKLYGREHEIRRLLDTFALARQGANKFLLVAGYSGIGKSSLVNEINRPVTEARGYFIAGKFDQFKRDIPYSAVIQAFQDLVRQLLTEESIEIWKTKLTANLSNLAQVIVDVIPEVELIIGPQEPVDALGSAESENRFNLVFRKFVRALADEQHPLTIFLDDLQWADGASLKLIHQLTTDVDTGHLLLLGAYRDNETQHGHPLLDMLARTREIIGDIEVISPSVLSEDDIQAMLTDALGSASRETTALAELVGEKTGGNPFFVREFLKELYRNGSLGFDRESGGWLWETERIRAMDITDNVVVLMAGKLLDLPETSRAALKIAACVGNRFDLELLAAVLRKSEAKLARELEPALALELILPLGDDYKYVVNEASSEERVRVSYRFVHDRVQQAAYQVIPEQERRNVHLMIGRLIPRGTGDVRRDERLIDIVNHLNLGSELITDSAERLDAARLNLAAGRNARTSAAYASYLKYLTAASDFLPADAWSALYETTLEIRRELLEAYYLNGDHDRADEFGREMLTYISEPLDRMRVYLVQVPAQNTAQRPEQALDMVKIALRELGIRLPKNPGKFAVIKDVLLTKIMLARRSPYASHNLPELRDPMLLATQGLLSEATTAAFFLNSDFFPIMILLIVRLSIRHGYSHYSPFAFSIYGMILNGTLLEFKAGYEYSKLALRLQDQLGTPEITPRILYLHGYFLHHWEHGLNESHAYLENAVRIGWETGNLEYTGYALCCRTFFRFLESENLDEIHATALKDLTVFKNTKQVQSTSFFQPFVQMIKSLGDMDDKATFYNHDEIAPVLRANKNYLGLGYSAFLTGLERALFNNYEGALVTYREAEELYDTFRGTPWLTNYHYFFGTCLLSTGTRTAREKRRNLREAKKHYKILSRAAHHQPVNRRHKALLLRAQLAGVRGRHREALDCFAQSIQFSRTHNLINDEALAEEKLGEYLMLQGDKKAPEAFTRARDLYARWGARAKAAQLTNLHRLTPPPAELPAASIVQDGLVVELSQLVEDTSRACERHTRFEYSNKSQVPLSQALREAMEELLKNAVMHGVESPHEREQAGKPPRGTISLRVSDDGQMLLITCEDNGRGLDADSIRRTALGRNLINERQAAETSTAGLYRLLFHAEYTTRPNHGFGLGLNRVRAAVRAQDGRIILKSRKGEFTRFQLRLLKPAAS